MTTETNSKTSLANFYKPAYVLFVLTGLFFLLKKDFSQATIYLSLALAFDPFDIKVIFNKRPVYQRIWLIVHLAFTLTVMMLLFISK